MKDQKQFINGLDIHLFSFLGEGCTNALLEAMACEKAVIAHRSGPFPEIISNHRDGIIVPAENSSAFAETLRKLMANRKLRIELGRKARLKIRKKFRREKQVDAYDQLFRKYANP